MKLSIRLYFYCELHDDGGYVRTDIDTDLPIKQIVKKIMSPDILYKYSSAEENFCSSKQCDDSYIVPFGFKIFDQNNCLHECFIKELCRYSGGFEYWMFDNNDITGHASEKFMCALNNILTT